MPEGHTVHRLAAAFREHFAGRHVDATSPQGRFAEGAALLDGRKLQDAEAHGKQMFLRFSGRLWLRVHLGLYGMWRFHGPGLARLGRRTRAGPDPDVFPPEPKGAVRLRLATPTHVADLSGPTACEILNGAEKTAFMAKLGEDPLREDADPARAFAKLHASRASIGQLLMRQDIIAGIGNIYRAEILFRARLNPHDPGTRIDRRVFASLWADLVRLMRDGVRTGLITTTEARDRGAETPSRRREFAKYVAYRAGQECRRCGATIVAEPMAGRTLYWCPGCQVA